MRHPGLFLCLIILHLAGCSDAGDESRHEQIRSNPVWGESVRALDKTIAVEQTLEDAAERQRQQIEEQER